MKKVLLLIAILSLSLTVSAQDYSVGQIIEFNDGTEGVIFYVSKDGSGLALSLLEAELPWTNGLIFSDINDIQNEEDDPKSVPAGVGASNTTAIIEEFGPEAITAANWCRSLGPEWYLPTGGELYYLFKIANAQTNDPMTTQIISKTLLENRNGVLEGWYWSSSEHNAHEAWNISASGRCSTEDKDDVLKVRAVRAF